MADESLDPDKQLQKTEEQIVRQVAKSVGLSKEQEKLVTAVVKTLRVERASFWKGPLPSPETLKAYNDAFPNGAERIFKMAEKQSDHRMNMENKVIPEEQRQSKHGQLFAFIIALVFLGVSAWLIYTGHDVAGTVIGTTDLVALATVFIIGRSRQSDK